MAYSAKPRTEEARGDPRTNGQLVAAALAYDSEAHSDESVEAAEELGNPRLCPALLKLWAERDLNREAFSQRVRRALASCACEIPEC